MPFQAATTWLLRKMVMAPPKPEGLGAKLDKLAE
jgi:hypothetical protein